MGKYQKRKSTLLRTNLLRMQKRCARLILAGSASDNSVQRFSKLGWIPVDNILRLRKLCIMQKIINGKCPDYFKEYTSVNDKHRYNTRVSTNNLLFIPFFRTKSGHRTFHASGTRLRNSSNNSSKGLTTLSNFRKHMYSCNLTF